MIIKINLEVEDHLSEIANNIAEMNSNKQATFLSVFFDRIRTSCLENGEFSQFQYAAISTDLDKEEKEKILVELNLLKEVLEDDE